MGHKCYISGMPYEITMSVQEGLPFAAHPYIEVMIRNLLAVMQTTYPVTICHFTVMANHIHFLFIVRDPKDFADFLCHFKSETAHAMNRLLGRTGKSFWLSDNDCPVILSGQKFLDRMEYLYLNPVKAGLVAEVKDYPGINSFKELLADGGEERWRYIPRTAYQKLPEGALSKQTKEKLTRHLLKIGKNNIRDQEKKTPLIPGEDEEPIFVLTIEPWAWIECFGDTRGTPIAVIKEEFLRRIQSEERSYTEQRRKKNHRVKGAKELCLEDPRRRYDSQRAGKKMICLSHCIEQRKNFIEWYRRQVKLARLIFQEWAHRETELRPPPGFFTPGGVLFAPLSVCPVPV